MATRRCDPDKKAFYEYHASLMEPWDGPAAVAFTDGRFVGATLDRNGLRPARYLVTNDGLVITGVGNRRAAGQARRGQVSRAVSQPGRMLLVDTEKGRIIPDEEIKRDLASRQPYGEWIEGEPDHARRSRRAAARLRLRIPSR